VTSVFRILISSGPGYSSRKRGYKGFPRSAAALTPGPFGLPRTSRSFRQLYFGFAPMNRHRETPRPSPFRANFGSEEGICREWVIGSCCPKLPRIYSKGNWAPAGDDWQGLLLGSGRPFPPEQLPADVAEVDVGIEALRRAVWIVRQHRRDQRREIEQFGSRQAHQFGQGSHTHYFLHCFDRANRGLLTEATATETAAASLATGTKRRGALALQPLAGERRQMAGRERTRLGRASWRKARE
jgi:hypothetical protein